MRRTGDDADVSVLCCPVTQCERDFCDHMKAAAGLRSDADMVRTALYRLARHLDVPVTANTFAVRADTKVRRARPALPEMQA